MNQSAERVAELTGALAAVRNRIALAAEAAGRMGQEVTLLPVTKFFPASDAAILWKLGCRDFGESRAQEAAAKVVEFAALTGSATPRWHMIGRIQRNKAKSIAGWADVVHSADSPEVVTALDAAVQRALDEGRREQPLRVFVQLSLDGDTARGGVDIGDPSALDRVCARVAEARALELVGLMAVAPLGADADQAFAALAVEHRRVLREHPGARELSAGMSHDLEAAVRHGSTCVRVGAALLGQRPLTSP